MVTPDISPEEYVPEQDPEFEEILYGPPCFEWSPADIHAMMVETTEPGWIGEISAD